MRRLLIIIILLMLPCAGQATEGDVVRALRAGNYPLAERLLTGKPGLLRYKALTQLGLGRTGAALALAEQVQTTDPKEQLAAEMIAATAAYLDSRPRRVDYHLARLRALLPKNSGPYADYGRFLMLSYQFDLDLNRNPKMPEAEIVRRHKEAWSLLSALQPSQEFTSETYWLTDVYNHAWIAVIQQTRKEKAGDVIVAAGLIGDLGLTRELGSRFLAAEQPGPALASLGITLTIANLALQAGDLARSEQAVRGVEAVLAPLYAKSPTPGYMAGLMASLTSLQGLQQYFRTRDGGQLERADAQATTYALESGNLEILLNTMMGRVDFYLEVKPQGWQASAEKVIGQAMALPGFLSTRRNQIWTYWYLGRLRTGPAAVENYQKAVTALEGYITDMGGGSMDQIRADFAPLYEALAKEQLKLGENPNAFETLGRWDQLQSSQAFSLDDLKERVPEADRKMVTRAQEQRDELSTRQSEVDALKSAGAPADEVQRATKLLADTRKSYSDTMDALSKKDKAFGELDIKPVNFSKLQRAIPADTLVLQMFSAEDRLYLMEATREKLVVREVAIKRDELDELVRQTRQQIVLFGRDPMPWDWSSEQATSVRQNLAALHKTLIAPAAPEMADKQVLALIPYGSLMYLPFQALLTEGPSGPRFLIEDKQLVVLCKATDLDQIYGPPSVKSGTLVAFGNPDSSLPGASQEVTALKTIFPDARVYLEGQATTDKMAGVQAPKVSYLHMATHGNLNAQDTRSSFLTMAKGQQLTVSDIAGEHLDSGADDLNLVTLSACQTAVAERNPTGSDLRTLADAFSLAGCRSMVASLWKVSDESTRDLMVHFYQALKAGKPKAQAMQEAQVAILRDKRYQHPFYWAPFILIGDWR